jgi:hypothetical protein
VIDYADKGDPTAKDIFDKVSAYRKTIEIHEY